MIKRFTAILAILAITVSAVFAQASQPAIKYSTNSSAEKGDDEYEEDDSDSDIYFDFGMNLPGDQYIKISLGLNAPLNFPNPKELFGGDSKLKFGGMGSLGYHYFLTSQIALGLDVGFGFCVSVGSHIFNTVPVVFSGTYEPTAGRFSFPLYAGLGFAWESYSGKNYFPGLVLRSGAGSHFRITESWTIGMELYGLVLPQFAEWHGKGNQNFAGCFLDLNIVARYMF